MPRRIATSMLCLAVLVASGSSAPAATTATVTVDAGADLGALNPGLNGVNHGPMSVMTPAEAFRYNSNPPNWIDLTDRYAAAGLSWVRTDEIAFGDVGDVFSGNLLNDVDDPLFYYFDNVDVYLQRSLDAGSKVIFRIGYSDNPRTRYFVAPSNYERYARIVVNMIRHFNDGWAGGHQMGIEYFEFWNEPDVFGAGPLGGITWTGTGTQLADFYKVLADAIKAYDPSLKVGGPAAARQETTQFTLDFLARVRETGAPLDFFSWHAYVATPQGLRSIAQRVRNTIDSYGFTAAESIITEYAGPAPYDGIAEAAFYAGVMSMLQDGIVSKATYYTGSPFVLGPAAPEQQWGMFEPFGEAAPRKNYYAAQQYGWLTARTPRWIASTTPDAGIPVLAGANADRSEIQILVTNLGTTHSSYDVTLKNLPFAQYTVDLMRVDPSHSNDLEARPSVTAIGGQATVTTPALTNPSTALLRLRAV